MSRHQHISRRNALFGIGGAGAALAAMSGPRETFAMAAQTPETGEGTAMRPYLTLETAQTAVDAALEKATEIGVPMIAVVVDDSGTMKAFARQDNAFLGSVTIAEDKAITAVSFQGPTHQLAEAFGSDPVMLASFANRENITLIGGGYPIMQNDTLVGGIGVSGGSAEQDQECAEAGLEAISN